MAIERLALGAHQRDPVPLSPLFDAAKPVAKRLGAGDQPVVGAAGAIAAPVLRPRPQPIAEENISDAGRPQRRTQRVLSELRMPPRIRHRADIGDGGDAGPAQKRDERGDAVIGMADGVDRAGRVAGSNHAAVTLAANQPLGHRMRPSTFADRMRRPRTSAECPMTTVRPSFTDSLRPLRPSEAQSRRQCRRKNSILVGQDV